MLDWLKPLPLMFYAPARGMAAVRDRVSLGASALLALVALGGLLTLSMWPLMREFLAAPAVFHLFSNLLNTAGVLVLLALVFVPAAVFTANLFERRGSFGVVLRQEYAAAAACVFYALVAASLVALLCLVLTRAGGVGAAMRDSIRAATLEAAEQQEIPPRALALIRDERAVPVFISLTLLLPAFFAWSVAAVREAFRLAWWRALVVAVVSGVLTLFGIRLVPILSLVLGSPFLLLLLFLLLRGYYNDVMRTQRARASFRQNLEAATLNPADASAHYNLGLIHLDRKQFSEARARFQRAVEIDPEETDAQYQLGRISRAENKLAEAIEHFGHVVGRAPDHAQHEVWREIGATYLAAGQFSDAHDALEKFLDRRSSDPEGLYLQGRALAGMGRRREAADLMRACIEAVRTAPAYKYRTEKRWLNEAQQFLRTQA